LQTKSHVPLLHTALACAGTLHALPQLPQFRASEVRFTQVPLQAVNPLLQAMPHFPALHVALPFCGALQAFVHDPQCAVEVVRSAQAPLQFVAPASQLDTHLPPEQTLSAEQRVVQLPQ
jgi:hypothetical protein